jgi:NifU-like protein involved in Fe-S cluster formation
MVSGSEYSAVAVDHAQKPRNVGSLGAYEGHARSTGPGFPRAVQY